MKAMLRAMSGTSNCACAQAVATASIAGSYALRPLFGAQHKRRAESPHYASHMARGLSGALHPIWQMCAVQISQLACKLTCSLPSECVQDVVGENVSRLPFQSRSVRLWECSVSAELRSPDRLPTKLPTSSSSAQAEYPRNKPAICVVCFLFARDSVAHHQHW
jgi:hypothetical protein